MRVAVIGGVNSTEVLVRQLAKHGFKDCAVWGYVPADSSKVSGWCDLGTVCSELGLPHNPFRKVAECEQPLRSFSPDILFVVGLSQLVLASMLDIASRLNVGFHPTALPEGRGRAAIAWLILKQINGAASFFVLGNEADDGAILVQEPFEISPEDDAASVEARILAAEARALDRWLPELILNGPVSREQDHAMATWFGRRMPEDGWIDWSSPQQSLMALIRASAPPHPGAYTFCGDTRIEILAASCSDRPETGVTGRIVGTYEDGRFEVQCGDALLMVEKWRCNGNWVPKTGLRLGYYVEAEVFHLRKQVATLEARLERLEQELSETKAGRSC